MAKWTGYQIPYTFVIGENDIWQLLPIDEVGAHAGRFNVPGLGVAFIGDFREKAPSPSQFELGVKLFSYLSRAFGLSPLLAIVGHTEAGRGASKDPNKDCPGKKFDLDFFRTEVAHRSNYRGVWSPEERRILMAEARAEKHGIRWED